ncbi:MAG: hypothetical protein ABH827_01510 [bacterium]
MQKLVIFSLLNLIVPLAGSLFGFVGATGLLFTFFVARKVLGFGLVTWGVPTLLASAKWAFDTNSNIKSAQSWVRSRVLTQVLNFLVSLVLPVLCMFLFMVHPVGQQAFVYSFYWVIPVIIYVVNALGLGKQGGTKFSVGSIFLTALSSTFIAHAVGSVMCLYMVPMVAAQWLALIPVVALERFVFAAGSTVAYVFVRAAFRRFYGVRVFGVQVFGVLCGMCKEIVKN